MASLVADKDRHQWFTPVWAAQILIETKFPDLKAGGLVIEPTCGTGTFLKAVPDDVRAIGVEIDPELAETARRETGREIVTGDFLTTEFRERPDAIIGNPPFRLDLIDAMLERCHDLLPEGGRAGFILPAYAFQTASRVDSYRRRWSLSQEMIPRNLFRNMMKPLCFATFTKDGLGRLDGFALYSELHDVNSMPAETVRRLNHESSPWERAVEDLHGHDPASAAAAISPKNPSGDGWWRRRAEAALARVRRPRAA